MRFFPFCLKRDRILTYRAPFGFKRVIPIQEIEEAYIEIGGEYKKNEWGFFRIVVRPKATSQVKAFSINMTVFAHDDMDKLMAILPMRE